MLWTPAKCTHLRTLWESGASFPVMQELLGVTGNSPISAKARRMGLAKRRNAPNGFDPSAKPRKQHPWRRTQGATPPGDAPRMPRQKSAPMPPWETAPADAPGVLDLTEDACKWPYDREGDGGGVVFHCPSPPLVGQPYCKAHAERSRGAAYKKKGA